MQHSPQAAKLIQLATSVTSIRPYSGIQRRSRRWADNCCKPSSRESHSFDLATRLRVARLILWRVGHGYASSISKLYDTVLPLPTCLCSIGKQSSALSNQSRDHLSGQTLSSPAVSPGANAVNGQSLGTALRSPSVDGSSTRAVLRQVLLHKHRQCDRRWVKPLTTLWKVGVSFIQQFGAGQNVEEIHGLRLMESLVDRALMLPVAVFVITITQG